MLNLHLPTLDSNGLLVDPSQIVNRLFIYFERSSSKQSDLYNGNVASYRFIKEEFGHDLEAFKEQIEETLSKMYGRYFDEVNFQITHELVNDALYQVLIKGSMSHNNETYYLNRNLTIDRKQITDNF